MNILLINHYAGSKSLGMEYRPWYLAKEWSKLGHNVTIVAGSYSHVRSAQPHIDKNYNSTRTEDIGYVFLKTTIYRGNGFKRMLSIFYFIFQLFRYANRISKESNPDLVIASSTYPLDIYPAHRIAKKTKAKLVFEVHDLWPLSPIELGGFKTHNPFIILLQAAENYAYKYSDDIVSLLPNTKQYMIEHGLSPDKFNYVPNGIDTSEWISIGQIPTEHDLLLTNLKQGEKKVVGYVGSHGLANELNSFIDSAKSNQDCQVAYLLVGNGPEKEKLKTRAQQLSLKNVYFLDAVPKKSIPSLLSRIDILYLGWAKNKLYRFGISPNKLFDYMMAGKPIIHSVDAANDAVKDSSCGISIHPEDPDAISDAIQKILSLSEEEINMMGLNARKYVMEKHDYKVLAQYFLQVLN
jgi:glycosyltransferase involved in cell wall biosynthesis